MQPWNSHAYHMALITGPTTLILTWIYIIQLIDACMWLELMPLITLTHAQHYRKMAVSVNKTTSGYIANQEAGVAFSNEEKIEVKQTGKVVWLQRNIYSRTNHYIKESHDYVPEDKSRKLTRYLYLVGFQWFFLVVFVIGLISPVFYIFAFIMGGISIPFILIFSQHMYVVMVTIPILLKLPHMPELPGQMLNDFYEISREKFTAVCAASHDTALGVAVASKGTMKVHMLSDSARSQVQKTRIVSVLAFCASIFMLLYCFAFGGYRTVAAGMSS